MSKVKVTNYKTGAGMGICTLASAGFFYSHHLFLIFCGRRLSAGAELKSATEHWLTKQPEIFYLDGIENLHGRQ